MRIYSSCIDAAKEIERDLVEMGQNVQPQTMQDINVADNPEYETKELIGYTYRITNFNDYDKWEKHFKLNRDWLEAEMNERTSGEIQNPGEAWMKREEVWKPFIHEGKFAYTYSERLTPQLIKTFKELNERPDTRQGVMTIYEGTLDSSNRGGLARVPCSMYYQFLLRKETGREQLNLIYTMRSCDFYTHFPYDVALAIGLQNHFAVRLGVETGFFQHFIGSLHAYKKDYGPRGIF